MYSSIFFFLNPTFKKKTKKGKKGRKNKSRNKEHPPFKDLWMTLV